MTMTLTAPTTKTSKRKTPKRSTGATLRAHTVDPIQLAAEPEPEPVAQVLPVSAVPRPPRPRPTMADTIGRKFAGISTFTPSAHTAIGS